MKKKKECDYDVLIKKGFYRSRKFQVIDFNGTSTHLELFYAKRLGHRNNDKVRQ